MVEQITFSPLRFIEHTEDSAYWKDVKDWFEWGHSFSLNDFAIGSARHFAAYAGFIAAQRFLYHDDNGIKLLVRCFKRLHNLRKIQVNYGNKIIGAADVFPPFGRMRGDEVSRNCGGTLIKLLESMYRAKVRVQSFELGDFGEAGSGPKAAAVFGYPPHRKRAILPVFEARKGVDSMVDATALCEAFEQYDRLQDHANGTALFHGLKELTLSTLVFEVDGGESVDDAASAIEAVVQSTNKLRKLSLGSLGGDFTSAHGRLIRPFIRQIMDFVYLKDLCELGLLDLTATESDVLTLMRYLAISGKLRTARLSRVKMSGDDSWASALEKMREQIEFSTTFPYLKNFVLQDCDRQFDIRDCHVEDYLRHMTDVNPMDITEDDATT